MQDRLARVHNYSCSVLALNIDSRGRINDRERALQRDKPFPPRSARRPRAFPGWLAPVAARDCSPGLTYDRAVAGFRAARDRPALKRLLRCREAPYDASRAPWTFASRCVGPSRPNSSLRARLRCWAAPAHLQGRRVCWATHCGRCTRGGRVQGACPPRLRHGTSQAGAPAASLRTAPDQACSDCHGCRASTGWAGRLAAAALATSTSVGGGWGYSVGTGPRRQFWQASLAKAAYCSSPAFAIQLVACW